jgi:GNAT superfamily N-acetyltransferase
MDIAITQITPARIGELLRLIRELARFERLEQEVEATAPSLRRSFFDSPPAAGALLANCDGQLAGYAIYFFTFSSFVGRAGLWLEDVYVRPKFRRQGVGGRLMRAVARIGAERNCGRFEWTALNWNQKALDFYGRLGARVMEEWVLLRLNAAGLRRLARRTRAARMRTPQRGVPTKNLRRVARRTRTARMRTPRRGVPTKNLRRVARRTPTARTSASRSQS